MTPRHGLWLKFSESAKLSAIDFAIEAENKFTAVIPGSIKPRQAELVIISRTGEFADYLGISRAGSRIATGEKRISLSSLVNLEELPVISLRKRLPRKHSSKDFCKESENRPSPKLWEELLKAIKELRPKAAKELPTLRKLIAEIENSNLRHNGGLEVFERDAVASAVQIFGGAKLRKRVLRSITPADERAPFLSRLKRVSLREDQQVIHDAATFPGMRVAHRYIVGATELANDFGERLTILHCNRLKLESTLGVDLIYFAHSYNSFILIQYKRMFGTSDDAVAYRPSSDKNYATEIDRLTKVERMLEDCLDSKCNQLNDFRLSTQSIFFKLCQTKVKAALDEGMVPGMYIPFSLWQQFMNSTASKGSRGGTFVNWGNAPRHLSNGEFTALVHRGWIGSAGTQSQYLNDIVETVLESNRSLIFAITSSISSGKDYLRDSYGRFAESDDPLASS